MKAKKTAQNILNHDIFIVWQPEFNIGIPIIDEQHRGLVTTINSIYYEIQNRRNGRRSSMLRPAINMLNKYIFIHFSTEEYFFEKYDYPQAEEHCKLHRELEHTLRSDGMRKLQNQEPEKFLEFIKTLWLEHIRGADLQFKDHIKEYLYDRATMCL